MWGRGGKELFYLAPGNQLMAAPLTLTTGKPAEIGRPAVLFTIRPGSDYDALPDGSRFLVNNPVGETLTSPITVILNWAGSKK